MSNNRQARIVLRLQGEYLFRNKEVILKKITSGRYKRDAPILTSYHLYVPKENKRYTTNNPEELEEIKRDEKDDYIDITSIAANS